MQTSEQQGQEIINSLIAKCWEDESFKQEFVSSPVEAIEKFTGKSFKLPEGKKLVVDDQTSPDFVYLNIPAKPDLESMELTDEQLEAVAGGITPTIPVYCALVIAGIAVGKCLN